MRLVLAALVCVCLAVSAWATELRSGEHADFSRIVVELPAVGDWTFGRHPEGYAFSARTLTAPNGISRLFQLIPRTRLAEVRFDPQVPALVFRLACENCHADAFEIRAARIVLDFKDGAAPAGNIFEQPFLPTAVRAALPLSTAQQERARAQATAETALVLPLAQQRSYLRPPAFQVPHSSDESPGDPLAGAERALVDALSRAMTQGLVKPADFIVSGPQPSAPETPMPKDAAPAPNILAAQTRIESDRAELGVSSGSDVAPRCDTEKRSWPLPQDIAFDDLGGLRARLFNALDRINNAAALDLAAAQVALGFGDEALVTLRLLSASDPAALYIADLAKVVAERPVSSDLVADTLACGDEDLVWAFLGASTIPALDRDRADKVVLQFFELTPQLRRQLGPSLVEKVLQAGFPTRARRISENVRRLDPTSDVDLALIDQGEAEHVDLDLETNAQVAAVLGSNEGSVTGLQKILQAAIDEDRDLSKDDLVFLDSIIFQFRQDAAGKTLARSKLLYALHRGQPGLARQALDVLTAESPTLKAHLLTRAFEIVESRGAEFEALFLRSYLDHWAGYVTIVEAGQMAQVSVQTWLEQNAPSFEKDTTEPSDTNAPTVRNAAPQIESLTLEQRMERLAKLMPSVMEPR